MNSNSSIRNIESRLARLQRVRRPEQVRQAIAETETLEQLAEYSSLILAREKQLGLDRTAQGDAIAERLMMAADALFGKQVQTPNPD